MWIQKWVWLVVLSVRFANLARNIEWISCAMHESWQVCDRLNIDLWVMNFASGRLDISGSILIGPSIAHATPWVFLLTFCLCECFRNSQQDHLQDLGSRTLVYMVCSKNLMPCISTQRDNRLCSAQLHQNIFTRPSSCPCKDLSLYGIANGLGFLATVLGSILLSCSITRD